MCRINSVKFDERLLTEYKNGNDTFDSNTPVEFSVTLRNTMPIGAFKTRVTISFEDEPELKYSVPVSGEIVGAIQVEPAELRFRDMKRGQKAKAQLVLMSAPGESAFSVLEASADFACISVVCGIQKSTRHELKLTVDTSRCDGSFYGLINVRTDLPLQSALCIPVSVVLDSGE